MSPRSVFAPPLTPDGWHRRDIVTTREVGDHVHDPDKPWIAERAPAGKNDPLGFGATEHEAIRDLLDQEGRAEANDAADAWDYREAYDSREPTEA